MILRLCLFCVKIFSYCSGKENIFKCLVAFLKISKKQFQQFGCISENAMESTLFLLLIPHFLIFETRICACTHTHIYIIKKGEVQPVIGNWRLVECLGVELYQCCQSLVLPFRLHVFLDLLFRPPCVFSYTRQLFAIKYIIKKQKKST